MAAAKPEAPLRAATLPNPIPARDGLLYIGATPFAKYRQYIEKDPALERRFQTVLVQEPTVEDTIAILRGLESRYEVFHGVKITDNAIIAAATLSNRYITDRFLPDKAIDLIDEACAMIRTEMDSMPTELDVINRKIIQMQIEEAALKNEDDELSKARLAELQKELAEQRETFNAMKAKWENEKNAIGRVQQLREKIEQLNRDIEAAEQSGEYSLAELYNLVIEHTSYEQYLKTEKDNPEVRIENIEELSSNIDKFEEDYGDESDLSAFLEAISLQTDIDNYDADADTCVMMTLHSAKGLEFPVVFIAGMEEGMFPSVATMMNPDELNEERRLAYVGITRAKEILYFTKTNSRMLFGSTSYNKGSRFLNEIPDNLLEYSGGRKQMFTQAASGFASGTGEKVSVGKSSGSSYSPNKSFGFTKPPVKSGAVFNVGDCVQHKVFGKGMVMKAEKMGNDTMLEIAFDKAGTKTLMANYCSNMKKI